MAPKPKKQDYKASEAEKTSASVAKAQHDFFKNTYQPLILKNKELAQSENFRRNIRGRMNAVVNQQVSAYNSSYRGARDIENLSNVAAARTSQLQKGDEAAKAAKNAQGINVIATANKQLGEAQSGLAKASRLATSELLNKAKTSQDVATAKFAAGVQLGGAALIQGIRNKQRGNSFFGGTDVGGGVFMENTGGDGVNTPLNEITLTPGADRRRSIGDRLGDGLFGGFFGGR